MKNVWTEHPEDGGRNKTDPLVMKILSSLCFPRRGRGGFLGLPLPQSTDTEGKS